ncbi:segregation/condensation protein A [Clostridium rectalis]|uniref:segregation/condensation protein A n=1 Tax=Clostridium rectalis TaxID=2040295 RepID=UPI000F637452|nr:segregation/condensation protein A [Clostridium rectalis]
MALNIKIDNFEGPFDLLLHLIKKNELDIYNIKISHITNQYITYINTMKEMDLEITSEFIVIAATLIEIKSKELLPKGNTDEIAAVVEEDPEKVLISKLIEYKKFKYAASFLKEQCKEEGIIFTKKPEIIEIKRVKDNEEILKNISMLDIYNIYNELIKNYKNKININSISTEIPIDTYKVEDKILELQHILIKDKKICFLDISKKCTSKIEIVVTFLALLEMIKLKTIIVLQEKNFGNIFIERSESIEGN